MRFPIPSWWLFLLLCAFACETSSLIIPDNYSEQHQNWQQERLNSLTSPTGWLSLVGLHWLKEGENLCGSTSDMAVPLPAGAPDHAATYTLSEGAVNCQAMPMVSTSADDNCSMRYGSFRWYLIERAGNFGIRVQDTLLPARIRLRPISSYDLDPNFRVRANWQPATAEATMMIRNILDMEYAVEIEGTLSFTLAGQKHDLIALDGGPDDLFLIFSDDTTGEETYGGGRYLYCSRPDAKGETVIDFNRSYNPPCAFTEYATCLLPLPENHLPLALRVGEKAYGDH